MVCPGDNRFADDRYVHTVVEGMMMHEWVRLLPLGAEVDSGVQDDPKCQDSELPWGYGHDND